MKRITFLLSSVLMIAVSYNQVAAQSLPIPPENPTVIIEATPGNLETIVNGDVDENGNRVNPNRVYMLKKGAVYVQQNPINFGGGTETDAVLSIVGEEGGAKPMVIPAPADGGGAFTNVANGNLTLKNIYWPVKNQSNEASGLFKVINPSARLIVEGLVVENAHAGDVFQLAEIPGELDVYMKNCYFRDCSQLENSWNFAILQRGDNGEPYDTLWVENTTVTGASMPFFGKKTPVNFMFFNHNLLINGAKYPIWYERYKEAYITNNMFINSNYEGECIATYSTQIEEDLIPGGLINVDTVESDWFSTGADPMTAIFYASDNLNYTSEYMAKYWSGGYNDVADYPISNRTWGITEEQEHQVFPVPLYNDRALGLAEGYENIKIERSHIDVNPKMNTEGMASQEVADNFAAFARKNYEVDNAATYDKQLMWFGDGDATTIPGQGTETGAEIIDMSSFPEDFSYTEDILSVIDGKHLGSLAWYPSELASYDSEAALEKAKNAYNGIIGIKEFFAGSSAKTISIYPNPASQLVKLDQDAANVTISNAIGQQVLSVKNYQAGTSISIKDLNTGIYFVSNGSGVAKLIVE